MSRGTLALFRDAAVFFELKGSGFLEPFTTQKMIWGLLMQLSTFAMSKNWKAPFLRAYIPAIIKKCQESSNDVILSQRVTLSSFVH